MRLSYLGPRFENTFYAWYDKEFEFPYGHIKAPHNMKFTNRAFCGQHWDAHDGLIFDSFFESGNLDLLKSPTFKSFKNISLISVTCKKIKASTQGAKNPISFQRKDFKSKKKDGSKAVTQ